MGSLHQCIDDLRAVLQDLPEHVTGAAAEATPVREDHDLSPSWCVESGVSDLAW